MQTADIPLVGHPTSLAPLGYALGAFSVLAFVALLHHPVVHGHDPAGLLISIRSQTMTGQIVHGTLAMIFGFLEAAMILFASRLGLWRFAVVFGLVAFSCACVMTVLAVMTDGFVIPSLAARCAPATSASCVGETINLIRLSATQIEFLTRFSFVGMAAAVVSWSIALLSIRDVPRWAGLAGLLSGGCQILALLAASGPLTRTSLLPIFGAQVAWYLLTALLLIMRRGPFAAVVGSARLESTQAPCLKAQS